METNVFDATIQHLEDDAIERMQGIPVRFKHKTREDGFPEPIGRVLGAYRDPESGHIIVNFCIDNGIVLDLIKDDVVNSVSVHSVSVFRNVEGFVQVVTLPIDLGLFCASGGENKINKIIKK